MTRVATVAAAVAVCSVVVACCSQVALRVRAKHASVRARGNSWRPSIALFVGMYLIAFAGAGLALRAELSGWRWALALAGVVAVLVAQVSIGVTFGSGVAWDARGVHVFRLRGRVQVPWPLVEGVAWNASKGFELISEGRGHSLPRNKSALEELADEIARRRETGLS